MSNLNLPRMTYANLATLTKGRIDRVSIAYKTTVERSNSGGLRGSWDLFLVRHHGNPIAEIGPDFFTIDNGGWNSRTTADRLNRIVRDMGANYHVRCCKPTRDDWAVVGVWRNGKLLRDLSTSVAHFCRTSPEVPFVLEGGDEYR